MLFSGFALTNVAECSYNVCRIQCKFFGAEEKTTEVIINESQIQTKHNAKILESYFLTTIKLFPYPILNYFWRIKPSDTVWSSIVEDLIINVLMTDTPLTYFSSLLRRRQNITHWRIVTLRGRCVVLFVCVCSFIASKTSLHYRVR